MVNLEYQIKDLSKKFNHPDKAYSILYKAAEQQKLPELERQYTLLTQRVGGSTFIFSIQLLIDYWDHGIPLHAKPQKPTINWPNTRKKRSKISQLQP